MKVISLCFRYNGSASAPYERPNKPSYQPDSVIQPLSAPQTSNFTASHQKKKQFQVPSKTAKSLSHREISDSNSESKTKWNRFTTTNESTDEVNKNTNWSNFSPGSTVNRPTCISKTATESKWSGYSNQGNERNSKSYDSKHDIPRCKAMLESNVHSTEVKSKWSAFKNEDVENDNFESDVSYQSLNSPRSTDSSSNLTGSKHCWNNMPTREASTKDAPMHSNQTVHKHNNLDSCHNVPSLSGSSHNAPTGKFSAHFGTTTTKSNLTKKKESDQKVNTGSKWGRYIVESKESSDEEEEEESVDQNRQGQIMVEIEGLNSDTINRQSLESNVFYTEQNFDLELEDW